jgi:hypothetical protein
MLKTFFSARIQGQLRHLLTTFGPLLAAHGLTTDAVWQLWVGLTMAILGFAGSWFAPEKGAAGKEGE